MDEPEARASMIWIIGEYAERIDNADELLESFVEGFHDENTQVRVNGFSHFLSYFAHHAHKVQNGRPVVTIRFCRIFTL